MPFYSVLFHIKKELKTWTYDLFLYKLIKDMDKTYFVKQYLRGQSKKLSSSIAEGDEKVSGYLYWVRDALSDIPQNG